MAEKMAIKKAQEIAEAIASAYTKWGKHASVNYTQPELYAAITVLFENGALAPLTHKAEVTKLNRQLAVCLNREKRRKALDQQDEGKFDARLTNDGSNDPEIDESVT